MTGHKPRIVEANVFKLKMTIRKRRSNIVNPLQPRGSKTVCRHSSDEAWAAATILLLGVTCINLQKSIEPDSVSNLSKREGNTTQLLLPRSKNLQETFYDVYTENTFYAN